MIVESLEGDARGRCKRRLRDERRTEDADEITAAWRIVSARQPVEVYLTKEARAGAAGMERALALRARGVPVAFEPLDERTAREYEHEIAWADSTSSPLDKLFDTPLPAVNWMGCQLANRRTALFPSPAERESGKIPSRFGRSDVTRRSRTGRVQLKRPA